MKASSALNQWHAQVGRGDGLGLLADRLIPTLRGKGRGRLQESTKGQHDNDRCLEVDGTHQSTGLLGRPPVSSAQRRQPCPRTKTRPSAEEGLRRRHIAGEKMMNGGGPVDLSLTILMQTALSHFNTRSTLEALRAFPAFRALVVIYPHAKFPGTTLLLVERL